MSKPAPLDAAASARARVYDEHRQEIYNGGAGTLTPPPSVVRLLGTDHGVYDAFVEWQQEIDVFTRQLFDDAYTLAVSRDALIVSLADAVRAGQDGANIAHEVGKLEGRAALITALAKTAGGKRGGRYVPPWIRAWIREQGAALRADSATLDDMIKKARAKQTTPVAPPPGPGSTEAARDYVARLTAEAEGDA